MKMTMSFLNMGLSFPLAGQGLFGGAGIVATGGDTSTGAGGLGVQYSLALEQSLGRGSVAQNVADVHIGHSLFSSAKDSRHKIVPISLLSEAAPISPWTEGARLALGVDGTVTVIESEGWRLSGSGESPASGATSKLEETKKWLWENLKTKDFWSWSEKLKNRIRNWNEDDKKNLADFLKEKLNDPDAGVRYNAIGALGEIVPGLSDESFRKEVAEKIVPLLKDETGNVIQSAAFALRDISLTLGSESLESLIEKVESIPAEDRYEWIDELLKSMKKRLEELRSGGNPESSISDSGAQRRARRAIDAGWSEESMPAATAENRPAPRPPEGPASEATSELKQTKKWVGEKLNSGSFWEWKKELENRIENWSEEDKTHLAHFLGKKLGDAVANVRKNAVWALGEIVPGISLNESFRRKMAKAIAPLLEDSYDSTRSAAVEALGEIVLTLGKESLKKLIKNIRPKLQNSIYTKAKKFLEYLQQRLDEIEQQAGSTAPATPLATARRMSRREVLGVGLVIGGGWVAGIYEHETLFEWFRKITGNGKPEGGGATATPPTTEVPITPPLSELDKMKQWLEEKLQLNDFWSWNQELTNQVQKLSEENKIDLVRFLGKKVEGLLINADADVLKNVVLALGEIVPGLEEESLRLEMAVKIVPLLKNDVGVRYDADYALREIDGGFGKESLEKLIQTVEKNENIQDEYFFGEFLANWKTRLEDLKAEEMNLVQPPPSKPVLRPASVENADFYFNTGSRYYAKGKEAKNLKEKNKLFKLAVTNLKKSLQLQPNNNKKSWHKLYFVYDQLGSSEESKKAFEKLGE